MEFGRDRVTIGSLYGPNQNEETFFLNLNSFLNRIQTPCLILGGDLNTTWDNRNVNDNLDIHAMINVPSIYVPTSFVKFVLIIILLTRTVPYTLTEKISHSSPLLLIILIALESIFFLSVSPY
jgi:hypothetical protein